MVRSPFCTVPPISFSLRIIIIRLPTESTQPACGGGAHYHLPPGAFHNPLVQLEKHTKHIPGVRKTQQARSFSRPRQMFLSRGDSPNGLRTSSKSRPGGWTSTMRARKSYLPESAHRKRKSRCFGSLKGFPGNPVRPRTQGKTTNTKMTHGTDRDL